MRSSRALRGGAALLLAACAAASPARAEQAASGFAVERFYPSAPGGGWLVMDDLSMRGPLGGAVALSGGYARDPLRVATTGGAGRLAVVGHQAFADVGVALTWERLRLSANLTSPLAVAGRDGVAGGYQLTAPSFDIGNHPDTLSDVRLGAEVRLLGDADAPLRVGLGAQLFVPSGDRADYVTDATYRGMVRALLAGQAGGVAWAGHLGVHLRPLDDGPAPGSPRGSELLFGFAAGPRLALGPRDGLVIGPELFGESVLSAPFGSSTTGVEAMLTARYERVSGNGAPLRVKLGAGGGLHAELGAPEWRAVVAVETSGTAR